MLVNMNEFIFQLIIQNVIRIITKYNTIHKNLQLTFPIYQIRLSVTSA